MVVDIAEKNNIFMAHGRSRPETQLSHRRHALTLFSLFLVLASFVICVNFPHLCSLFREWGGGGGGGGEGNRLADQRI